MTHEEAIKILTELKPIPIVGFKIIAEAYDLAIEALEKQIPKMPKGIIVDAVPVVRCKDCIHHEDEEPGMVYCPAVIGSWVSNDFFCGDGERREETYNEKEK